MRLRDRNRCGEHPGTEGAIGKWGREEVLQRQSSVEPNRRRELCPTYMPNTKRTLMKSVVNG